MALKPVTDPELLQQLGGARKPVTDAALLAQLNGESASSAPQDKLLGPWASAAVRPLAKGIAALPLLAMDSGVASRNLLTGGDYELPSSMFNKELDAYTTTPEGLLNKGAEFVSSVLAGARTPVPQAATQAPTNFVKPTDDLVRQATLAASRKAGYVVPPATTNPTATNKILESIGGKIATAQDAAIKNQGITNTLAKRAVGLAEDAPITKEALQGVRAQAGDAYQTLRQVGGIALDAKATQSLDDIASKYTGSALSQAIGGGNDIPKIVQAIKNEPLNGSTVVDAINLLRDKASVAYAGGDKGLGKAYRAVSTSLEELMERNLTGDALRAFRDARQLIAKSHSVESALNPSTGNVVTTKLTSQLAKNKPLSGDLLTAARFGQAFPKAAREIVDSGSVRNTDVILGAGTAALSREPWYLVYPFLRQGVRSGLLSEAGQSLATPGAAQIPAGLLLGGMTAEEQARQALLGQ